MRLRPAAAILASAAACSLGLPFAARADDGVVAAAMPPPPLHVSADRWPADAGGRERTDLRLWRRRGASAFGIGLASSTAPALPGDLSPPAWRADAASIVLGLRVDLDPRSRLFVDAAARGVPGDASAGPTARVGFELRPSSPMAGLARGNLLRVQWSSRENLSLRLRKGGLMVAYRAQF